MKLTNTELFKDKAYINGEWIDAPDGKTFNVVNPATGEIIASVANMGAETAETAIAGAKKAQLEWRKELAKERARILRKWYDLIQENAEDLAIIMTAEQGKPLHESRGEIQYAASFVEWFSEEAKRVYGDTIPTHKEDARVLVTKEPVGVTAAITPWNFPSAMITRKVAPALAAGCTMVLKPAEDTPLSALALARLAEEAGFPAGAFSVITSDLEKTPEVGRVLSTHPDVRKISFTGSTEVGKILMGQAADTIKKVSLELGGNAPFIIFDSADMEKALDGIIACKFRNMGQTCVCANRIFVHEDIYEEFSDKLAGRMKKLTVGPGDQDGVQVGPLINEQGVDKVKSHVEDALENGAELVLGGEVDEAGPLFYKPTLLKYMKPEMKVFREETFGPVAALFKFRDEDEVIRLGNETRFGLAAYFYTTDLGQAFRVSEGLEYGMVGVNQPVVSAEAAPFGGVKESGIGREGSKYGIDEFTEIKYTLMGGL